MSRWLWYMGSVVATIVLLPAVALADNCSSVDDCWGSAMRCALSTAAGVGGLPIWDKLFGGGEQEPPGVPDTPPPEGDDPIDDSCT